MQRGRYGFRLMLSQASQVVLPTQKRGAEGLVLGLSFLSTGNQRLSGVLALRDLNDLGERLRVADGDVGQDLTV